MHTRQSQGKKMEVVRSDVQEVRLEYLKRYVYKWVQAQQRASDAYVAALGLD